MARIVGRYPPRNRYTSDVGWVGGPVLLGVSLVPGPGFWGGGSHTQRGWQLGREFTWYKFFCHYMEIRDIVVVYKVPDILESSFTHKLIN